ncbi:MAG TPA: OmpA family protein [Pyrinomonadaceae bacterium]|nr:OmpA family protein [Pyrinomonadaceae bacterium]
MRNGSRITLRGLVAASALALALSPAAPAQTSGGASSPSRQSVAAGQKMKVRGVVVGRGADTFTVQDMSGAQVTVALTDRTSVKTKGSFLGGGTRYAQTAITRGLNLEVEGRGDALGVLVAEKIRFNDSDLRTARTVEANIVPVEGRVGEAEGRIGEAEQSAGRMSGQIEELAALSNAARGGAVSAQETADRAVEGVRVANDRINALDDFTPARSINVNFRNRSAVLTADAKQTLDEVATFAQGTTGYLIEIKGFAYESRDKNANRRLSEQRAESVVRYLVEHHNIPVRRILTPFGYGNSQPVADNTTREGRAENRRAEVRVLINRGLTQDAAQDHGKISAATRP